MITHTPVTVTSDAWTPIAPLSGECHELIISETGQAGTTDYYIAAPTSAWGPRRITAGKELSLKFTNARIANQPVFYMKTVSGTTTFDLLELT